MNRKTVNIRVSEEAHAYFKKKAKGKTITQIVDEIIKEERVEEIFGNALRKLAEE